MYPYMGDLLHCTIKVLTPLDKLSSKTDYNNFILQYYSSFKKDFFRYLLRFAL